jgi:predicted O-methyltransferase YrrM
MHMHQIIEQQLAAFRALTGRTALNIVETGSIRFNTPEHEQGDGWSTLQFARDVQANGGNLISVDLDTSVAREVLIQRGIEVVDNSDLCGVHLIEGHSIEVLGYMALMENGYQLQRPIDVLLLDSANEADLILHEWLVAKQLLAGDALLMVDDVDLSSPNVVKGHRIIPWLDQHDEIDYKVVPRTGGGVRTGVLTAHVVRVW